MATALTKQQPTVVKVRRARKLDNVSALDAIQQILSTARNNSVFEKCRQLSEITQIIEHTGREIV
jgi:hypothetical protein